MTDKKALWSEAGRAGLFLGLVSIAGYIGKWAIGKYCTDGASLIMGNVGGFILWGVKFAACILLLRYFMKAFAASGSDIDNSDTFRFGMATALLSSLIYSAFTLAFVLFIQPDIFNDAMDMLRDNPMMNDAAMEAMENMAPHFPAITFFSNLIWCWLIGLVLSAILSRNIPARNPFEN